MNAVELERVSLEQAEKGIVIDGYELPPHEEMPECFQDPVVADKLNPVEEQAEEAARALRIQQIKHLDRPSQAF